MTYTLDITDNLKNYTNMLKALKKRQVAYETMSFLSKSVGNWSLNICSQTGKFLVAFLLLSQ